eukprot:CAMPEP_0119054580 /NCGR_PEP_ID=MMETSP1177-20130426/75160_1 /TAXON_ID=2985 /ORGANISM="Ochromonas sp, Strain CCMP1899" /LENGTH=276 /DNA_ID=CAMNT_0007034863 /DNA_START=4052 /DNA_END=4878 /DNA_ORIENTATION=+
MIVISKVANNFPTCMSTGQPLIEKIEGVDKRESERGDIQILAKSLHAILKRLSSGWIDDEPKKNKAPSLVPPAQIEEVTRKDSKTPRETPRGGMEGRTREGDKGVKVEESRERGRENSSVGLKPSNSTSSLGKDMKLSSRDPPPQSSREPVPSSSRDVGPGTSISGSKRKSAELLNVTDKPSSSTNLSQISSQKLTSTERGDKSLNKAVTVKDEDVRPQHSVKVEEKTQPQQPQQQPLKREEEKEKAIIEKEKVDKKNQKSEKADKGKKLGGDKGG